MPKPESSSPEDRPGGVAGGTGPRPSSRPSPQHHAEPALPHADPAQRKLDEDWLDLQENLARTPADTRRLDLIFFAATLGLTILLVVVLVWLFR